MIKSIILLGLSRAFGVGLGTAAAVGLMLAQGGEFGFVLFALARQAGVLPEAVAQSAVLVVGLSMAMTPLLLSAAQRTAHGLQDSATSLDAGGGSPDQLRGHVLIAGYGRVGQTLAWFLESRGTPFLALDLDPERVAEARRRDLPVYYGDASRAEVLKAAGVERADAVVVTVDEPESASRTVHLVRRLVSEVPVIARARDVAQCDELTRAGATAAIPEVVEGSLQLVAALLGQLDVSSEEVDQILAQYRRGTYGQTISLSAG